MSWDSSNNAGFSAGMPWIKVNPNYKFINAQAQQNDSNSVLNYFRKIVKLHKNNPVLISGKYTLPDKENPNVYAYTRELDGSKFLIMLNFTKKSSTVNIDIDFNNSKLLLDNYTTPGIGENLLPYEARIYEL